MGVEKDIEVGVLFKQEAMKLFNKFVGNIGEEHKFKDLATAIVGECGGLPIAIVPIARALRNRDSCVWEDALNKIRRCAREGYETAYPIIKTSYDFLKSKQEKLILLPCSLHKEDTNVSVEDLMRIYGAYSDKFREVDTLEEARISVLASIDNLKGCRLLLSGDRDGTFKLHDVIRRIMVSIALEEEHMWCFENFERLKQYSNRGRLEDSSAILVIDHDTNQLPENLACPRLLKLLLVHAEKYRSLNSPAILFPEGFFEEAKELRALCLRSFVVKPLPLVFSSLQNLQTLSLQNCVIEDLAFIGELDNLEVLDLSNSKFEQLPQQIGKLNRLRQLNLNNCAGLRLIQPNVISRLLQLEELYMDNVSIEWRTKTIDGESTNATIDELNMSQLRALHLCISDASVLPKCMFVDAKLKRFNITVGHTRFDTTMSRLLQLRRELSQLQEYRFQESVKEYEELRCIQATSSRVLHLQLHGQNQLQEYRFQELMKEYEVLRCIQATSSRVLQLQLHEQSQLQEYGFQELMKECEVLCLGTLPGVNNIICQLDADGFPQLKELYIRKNDEVQHIVESTGEIQPCSAFQSLETLELDSVQNLKKICCGTFTIMPFEQLRRIKVSKCNKLKNVLPYVIDNRLEAIEVVECNAVKEIVYLERDDAISCDKFELTHLRSVTLKSLPNLSHFFSSKMETTICHASFPITPGIPLFDAKVAFPSLEILVLWEMDFLNLWPNQLPEIFTMQNLTSLDVTRCHKLKYVFPFVIVGGLMQLERLWVTDCSAMEEIIIGVEEERMSTRNILFPKLKHLWLVNLESLQSFCDGDCNVELESLLQLTIIDCPLLETFTTKTRVDQEIGQPLINEKVVFKTLQYLTVEGCNRLLSLWELATSENIQQLEQLEISGCERMEEILVVAKEAGDQERKLKISFPELDRLELKGLPKLRRFCQGYCTIERAVEEREMAEEVLFDGKVFFKNLQDLTIEGCKSILFLTAETESLQHLKMLWIHKCEVMEEVVVVTKEAGYDQQRNMRKISFPKLENLLLTSLPRLQRFCLGDCTIEFPSLLALGIFDCPELKTFIAESTPSTTIIVKDVEEREVAEEILFSRKVVFKTLQYLSVGSCNSLLCLWELATFENIQHLKELSIYQCRLMEEILAVAKEAGDQERKLKKISFPKLESLKLYSLPKLKRFCQGDCTIEFLSPLKLKIEHCTVLRTLIPNSTCSTSTIERAVIVREMAEEVLFNGKVVFKTLRCLTIKRCDGLLSLWDLATFENLRHLESLNIKSCGLMELVLVIKKEADDEERKMEKISFPKLRSLDLEDLPKLTSFCQGDCTIELPSLSDITIRKCPELRTFIAKFTRSTSTIDEVVEEREMADEILFNGKVVFKTLQYLTVEGCNRLLSLWELATSENIQHLQRLEISGCEHMEEILVVAKEAGDHERKLKKISFPELDRLELKGLPKLRRFCQGYCTIERAVEEREMADEVLFDGKVVFRTLRVLHIKRCNSLLSLSDLATFENLQHLDYLSIKSCARMELVLVIKKEADDEERKMEKISFLTLRSLDLKDLPKLTSFCQGDCTIELPSLSDITICKCPELRTFIPKFNRSTITIEEAVEEREMADEILFNGKVAFSNLKELCVKYCENLKYLLPFTNAEKLVQLKKLKVTGCRMLEEIVVVEEEEEEEEEGGGGGGMSSRKILFPDLTSLTLINLESLKAICAGDCTIGNKSDSSSGEVTCCPLLETLNEKVAFPIRYGDDDELKDESEENEPESFSEDELRGI